MILMVFLSSIMMTVTQSKFMMWVMMEINTMTFLMWMMMNSTKNNKMPMPIYLVISFLASSSYLLFLMSNKMIMVTMAMLIKMAIPPFHSWMVYIVEEMNNSQMFTLFSIQKIQPIYMSMMFMSKNAMTIFLTIWSIMMLKMYKMTPKFKQIMMMSSISMSNMMMVSSMISKKLTMTMFLTYSLSIYILMLKIKSSTSEMKMEKMVLMINLSGIPPTPMFFMKMNLMKLMMNYELNMMIIPMTIMMTTMMYSYNQSLLMMMPSMKLNKKMSYSTLILMLSPMILL